VVIDEHKYVVGLLSQVESMARVMVDYEPGCTRVLQQPGGE